MTRLEKFESFKDHAMHCKIFKKLTKDERAQCINFINESEHLDKNEFAFKVNRWLVGAKDKPKHATEMWALVSQSV